MSNQKPNLSSPESSPTSSGATTPSSYSGASTPLTTQALAIQNANPLAVDQEWALDEAKRVMRLQQAARELGFDLPPQCYRK